MSKQGLHFGVLAVDLFFPDPQSLKEKRMILKGIKDKLRKEFNVSVAEVEYQDTWQRISLALGMVATDQPYLNAVLDQAHNFLGQFSQVQITRHELTFF